MSLVIYFSSSAFTRTDTHSQSQINWEGWLIEHGMSDSMALAGLFSTDQWHIRAMLHGDTLGLYGILESR